MQQITKRVIELYNLFELGLIPIPEVHELVPDVNPDALVNYLTMAVCLNYQRSSINFWKSAYETYKDEQTRDVFLPQHVADMKIERLRELLLKHKLALQPNKQPIIWQTIGTSLAGYGGAMMFLDSCNFDCKQVLEFVGSHKKQFPYLSGLKLSSYWLMILAKHSDVTLHNKEYISIIPDTHIIKASKMLGVIDTTRVPKQEIIKRWFDILSGIGIDPYQLHSVLWHWSRNGFLPAV